MNDENVMLVIRRNVLRHDYFFTEVAGIQVEQSRKTGRNLVYNFVTALRRAKGG